MNKIKLIATASFQGAEPKSTTLQVSTTLKAYVTFKPNSYKGGYGFDWCEWNIDTGKIEKFQDTKASDIGYTFNNAKEEYETATDSSKQDALKSLYPKKIDVHGKKYYSSWMNLSKGETANLELTITNFNKKDKPENEEYITFKENSDYDVIYGGVKNEAIKLPLKKKNAKYNIEIFAKNETTSTSYIKAMDVSKAVVGKIEMHPNEKAILAIKVIPVVLKSTVAKEKKEAADIYNKAIKAKATGLGINLDETLNKHSLNQAGIKSVIEAMTVDTAGKADPEKIVIDLTKGNWTHFYNNTNKTFEDWKFDPTEPDPLKRPSVWESEDGDETYKYEGGTTNNDLRLLLDELEDEYYQIYGRDFKGALVFVTDKSNSKSTVHGYSQTNPIRSQGVIMFKGGLESDFYAHELGHVLGLEHVFFKPKADLKPGEDIECFEVVEIIKKQKKNISIYEENIEIVKKRKSRNIKTVDYAKLMIKDTATNPDGTVNEGLAAKHRKIITDYEAKIIENDADIKMYQNKIIYANKRISINIERK